MELANGFLSIYDYVGSPISTNLYVLGQVLGVLSLVISIALAMFGLFIICCGFVYSIHSIKK